MKISIQAETELSNDLVDVTFQVNDLSKYRKVYTSVSNERGFMLDSKELYDFCRTFVAIYEQSNPLPNE
jgi:hypothetical protein